MLTSRNLVGIGSRHSLKFLVDPDSDLLLAPFNPAWSNSARIDEFASQIYSEFANFDVDPSRIILIRPVKDPSSFAALYNNAKAYLDSFPYAACSSLPLVCQEQLPIVAHSGNNKRSLPSGYRQKEPAAICDEHNQYVSLAINAAPVGNNSFDELIFQFI